MGLGFNAISICLDEPGAANYEFESALALEKQRQELQRRIDELDGSEQQPSSRGRVREN